MYYPFGKIKRVFPFVNCGMSTCEEESKKPFRRKWWYWLPYYCGHGRNPPGEGCHACLVLIWLCFFISLDLLWADSPDAQFGIRDPENENREVWN